MYKAKEIKNMKFDCFHLTGEYMDCKQLSLEGLTDLLSDFEHIEGTRWNWNSFYSNAYLCAVVETLYKHNYITCFTGEMYRPLLFKRDTLAGESSLLKYVQESNFRERQEKLRLKKYGKKPSANEPDNRLENNVKKFKLNPIEFILQNQDLKVNSF